MSAAFVLFKLMESQDQRLCERTQCERDMFMQLIGMVSAGANAQEMLRGILPLLQHWSECEVVGIRLRVGHNHPYVETEGFAEDYVRLENTLSPQETSKGPRRKCGCKPDTSGKGGQTQSNRGVAPPAELYPVWQLLEQRCFRLSGCIDPEPWPGRSLYAVTVHGPGAVAVSGRDPWYSAV